MSSPVYQLSSSVTFECFEDGALILNLKDITFTELNMAARDIVQAIDGKNSIEQVAKLIAKEYEIDLETALQDVNDLYKRLVDQEIIEDISVKKIDDKRIEGDMDNKDQTVYMCNPDVVLREEDEDGGLLFNPDTNQVKVINTTGLFIWKQFAAPNKSNEVSAALLSNFEEAPEDVVQTDLKEFMDEMILSGFIGEVK